MTVFGTAVGGFNPLIPLNNYIDRFVDIIENVQKETLQVTRYSLLSLFINTLNECLVKKTIEKKQISGIKRYTINQLVNYLLSRLEQEQPPLIPEPPIIERRDHSNIPNRSDLYCRILKIYYTIRNELIERTTEREEMRVIIRTTPHLLQQAKQLIELYNQLMGVIGEYVNTIDPNQFRD
jgi:hypothetical protein